MNEPGKRRRLADNALAMAALSARLLGWRPAEFWAATPAELEMTLGTPDKGDAPDHAMLASLFGEEWTQQEE